jgi:hypothetical protein
VKTGQDRRPPYPDLDAGITRETLAQLDETATCSEHWKILITAGTGFFTDAYDLFIIGVAATLITAQWHIASYQRSLLSSLALLSSAAGAVFFGRIADKLGRRKVYGYEVLVLAAGAIASACSPGIWWLIAFRGVLGFGIGGDYPVSAIIMSECASRHDRGRMVALVFSMQGAGLILGPLVTIALLKAGISHDMAWRVMLAAGAIPALAVFWLRRRMRETPRFLLAQQEARQTGQQAAHGPAGFRGMLAEPKLLRWLAGASLAWLAVRLRLLREHHFQPGDRQAGFAARQPGRHDRPHPGHLRGRRPTRIPAGRRHHRQARQEAHAGHRIRGHGRSLPGTVAHPGRHHDSAAVPAPVRRDLLLRRVRPEHHHVRLPG